MRQAALVALTCVLAASVRAVPGDPAGPDARSCSAEVSIPNTQRLDFVSKVNGRRYSLSIALPFEPAPAKGYGVLYVLDSHNFFASATEAVRLFNAPGVVVVGIGYPEDAAFVASVMAKHSPLPAASIFRGLPPEQIAPQLARFKDLSLPASDRELESMEPILLGFPKLKSDDVGGVDDFLKVIETEVKPKVAALVSVDPANQALFGHSLAGLATLHALLVEPNAFRTFIIVSPSIWWNNREVLTDEPKFAAMVNTGGASPHVLVAIGSEESTVPKDLPRRLGQDRGALAAELRAARMVENGGELVTWLKSLHGSDGYRVEDYAVFEKEGHNAAPWSALARAIPFAFPAAP